MFSLFVLDFCCRMQNIGQLKVSGAHYKHITELNNYYRHIANGFVDFEIKFLKKVKVLFKLSRFVLVCVFFLTSLLYRCHSSGLFLRGFVNVLMNQTLIFLLLNVLTDVFRA